MGYKTMLAAATARGRVRHAGVQKPAQKMTSEMKEAVD
jgi:hypothetical protein